MGRALYRERGIFDGWGGHYVGKEVCLRCEVGII